MAEPMADYQWAVSPAAPVPELRYHMGDTTMGMG